jgi:hypothetical protein
LFCTGTLAFLFFIELPNDVPLPVTPLLLLIGVLLKSFIPLPVPDALLPGVFF